MHPRSVGPVEVDELDGLGREEGGLSEFKDEVAERFCRADVWGTWEPSFSEGSSERLNIEKKNRRCPPPTNPGFVSSR